MHLKDLPIIRSPSNLAFLRDVFFAAVDAKVTAAYEVSQIPNQVLKNGVKAALIEGTKVDRDKDPVLVLPGFSFNDLTTLHLRREISRAGFPVYGTGVLVNTGAHEGLIEKLEKKLFDIYEKYDKRPVSLIGHSVGGIQAFLLANRHPDKVHPTIFTLGTPFGPAMGSGGGHKHIHGIFNFLNDPESDIFEEIKSYFNEKDGPPEIHAFSSHWDGVIAQEASTNPFKHLHGKDHIMEMQTHCGMGWSRGISRALVEALQEQHELKRSEDADLVVKMKNGSLPAKDRGHDMHFAGERSRHSVPMVE